MPHAKSYRPLTRPHSVSLLFRQRLWLAADHLLLVRSYGFSEEYRRVFFGDLQALRIQPTRGRLAWNIVWFSLALFTLLLLLAIGEPAGRVVFGAFAGFFLLAALINTLLGPTCRFWLHTPAGAVRVACVKRVFRAEAIADRIRPLIRQAQQALSEDERRALAAPAVPATPGAVTAAMPSAAPRRPATPRDLQVVTWAFLVPILYGSLELVLLGVNNVLLSLLELIATLSFGIMMVVAIVRQRGRPLGIGLLALAWTGVGLFVLLLLAGQAHQMILAMGAEGQVRSQLDILRHQASLTGRNSLFILYANSIAGGLALLLGLAGLLLLRRHGPTPRLADGPPVLPGQTRMGMAGD